MSITIIFGGQFGSEGKGKTAHYFAAKEQAKYCVRVGGTNSGHTVYRDSQKFIFRILPTGIIEKHVSAILPAGAYIDLLILKEEIKASGLSDDRLLIDENAVIISESNVLTESESGLQQSIGSTNSGTGAAVIDRILRRGDGILAKNCKELRKYIVDTKSIMRDACNKQKKIIIEGTQGYGLSLLHSKDYPYVTSRDTSAAGFLSETGLSPLDVENVVMVIRAFPIRVSGNSGPLPNEIDWDIIRQEAGRQEDMTEYTACTERIRRVARFDAEIVKRSIECNQPNIIVLNHLDYFANYKTQSITLVNSIQEKIGGHIDYVGIDTYSLIEVTKINSEVIL
ncbi:MAG: adenylosuccinate synthetase [Bacteroidales bacterium]|jgi:adenylosuccinate synthase|nr:adenylosuccinate synthetase [Bacteroidales bacterium]